MCQPRQEGKIRRGPLPAAVSARKVRLNGFGASLPTRLSGEVLLCLPISFCRRTGRKVKISQVRFGKSYLTYFPSALLRLIQQKINFVWMSLLPGCEHHSGKSFIIAAGFVFSS